MSILENDCTVNCKLLEHGNLLTKCLTRREINEEKLISYMILSCGNFSRNLDEYGRSALHVACSNSKFNVAEFLLRNGANINQKDKESAYTPLHRAVYYCCFDLVVLLKRYGASFDYLDSDYYTPLQLIPNRLGNASSKKLEFNAFVWGKNKNYNIGLGNTTVRDHPDAVKGLPPIQKVSVNKYHSLFLTSSGALWGCGHNKEGRLGVGLGSDATLTVPQDISIKWNHKNEKIVEISSGLSHSLILTNKSVYAAGSNRHLQLGIKNVDSSPVFREMQLDRTDVDFKKSLSIVACDFHSVIVSRNGVFVCGLNVGQFGGIQESIMVPRRLPYPMLPNLEVEWANSNNAAICVYVTDQKSTYLHIFCNRKIKTYKNPLNEKLKQCAISGGEMLYNSDEVVKSSTPKLLTITILTTHWNLYVWYEDIMQFVKIHLSSTFTTQISSISTCGEDLLVTANSHLFHATFQHKAPKLYQLDSEYQEFSSKRDIAQFTCSKLAVKRIAHLSNVKEVSCDSDGESFVAIVSHVALHHKDLKKEAYDFSMLLDEDPIVNSGILDVEFEVKWTKMRSSRFIVGSRCEYLKNLMESDNRGETCVIKDRRLTVPMFQAILLFIYKDNLSENDLQIACPGTDDESIRSFTRNFLDIAFDWKLDGIHNCIVSCKFLSKYLPKHEKKEIQSFNWFSSNDLPELYDVTILLDENQRLQAHKVVLMSRIEYFRMMFYHNWSENKSIDVRHISINFMRPIVKFAYDNDAEALRKENFSDNFTYNMCIICDQYLMETVKNIFETIIMRRINLRNVADNFDFSIMYNCHLLKEYCMEYISLNLSRILEGNVLDTLDTEALQELSQYYKKYFKFDNDSNRIITPAFDAPSDSDIDVLIEGFDLASHSELLQQAMKKTPKSKTRLSKSELSKRNYEKEGMKSFQEDVVQPEPSTPKITEVHATSPTNNKSSSWQQKRERRDSGKKKVLTALKCNEIMKTEVVTQEPMIDLRNLRNSVSEEPEVTRNSITLADFGIKHKKKSISRDEVAPVAAKPEIEEVKPAWKMDSIELKPINQEDVTNMFKASIKKKSNTTAITSSEKKLSSIIRDERKDKSNYEKIKSKSLILTQIEEKAILDLSEFYNIDNIFDENIKIQRKVINQTQNLSQWTKHQ